MQQQNTDDTGRDADLDALAVRVCELLGQEPLRSRLLAALGLSQEAEPALPAVREPSAGPVPIGPYEIMPEFRQVRWDGVPPTGGEWAEVAVNQTPEGGDKPLPVSAGPRPGQRGKRS